MEKTGRCQSDRGWTIPTIYGGGRNLAKQGNVLQSHGAAERVVASSTEERFCQLGTAVMEGLRAGIEGVWVALGRICDA